MINTNSRQNLETLLLELSDKKIENFKKLLYDEEINLNSDIYELKSKLSFSSQEAILVKKIFVNMKDPKLMILCIDLLSDIEKLKQVNKNNNHLVWTSPIIFHEKADNTKSTIIEMINSANHTITIVGYTIEPDTTDVFDALIQASKRKVRVRLIFDKAKKYLKIIAKMWESGVEFPTIYTYKPIDKQRSSLHAKLLIVDSDQILVTSANLTGRGISRNVEVGIRHFGDAGRDAENLVNTLIDNKFMVLIYG